MKVSRSESMGSRSNSGVGGGRAASIVLLDERRLDLMIQPRLLAGELLDLVSSHCGLKEKEYFGLALVDEKGLYTWLTLDRKVLEHDLPRKPPHLTLHFLVKFFIESISHLSETKTVELFYLQARSLVFRGTLEVESDIVFQLAALGLQAMHLDYVDDPSCRCLLKKSPLVPLHILKEHSSLSHSEECVIHHYKKTKGQTRGQALVNYMTIVESMPTYGVHYFEVFDKRQKPWWLGLSCKGIAQYSYQDRKVPVRVFQWKRLENLYFRDKKFSIEVHDLKRVIQAPSSTDLYDDSLKLEESSLGDTELLDAIHDSTTRVSTSRRSFHPGSIRVYVWFGKTQGLTKCIWQSAISQHQFYLDRKRAKLRHHAPPRTLNEIARELTRSSASLSSASSISNLSRQSSTSTHSLVGAMGGKRDDDGNEENVSEETRRARIEMLSALRARREALDSKLKEKTKLLKELCLKEGELTGDLPPETPCSPGESLPTIRRRVGTEFELNFERLLLNNTCGSSPQEDMLANLELEREIQMQITNAALKISNDMSVSKSVRKQRKISYQQSQRKLKEIETKLSDLRLKQSSKNKKSFEEESELRRRLSVPDLERCPSNSSLEEDVDEIDNQGRLPLSPRSCPTSPRKNTSIGRSSESMTIESSSNSQRFIRTGGYVPNSVYLRSSYRVKRYPTLTSSIGSTDSPLTQRPHYNHVQNHHQHPHHHHHHMPVPTPEMVLGSSSTRSATLPSPYRNKFELNSQCDSPVGLYNCPQQRTSQAFSSLDDIDALQQLQQNSSSPGARRLEAAAGNYPSLERSARKKFNRNEAVFVPQRPSHPPPPLPPPPSKEIHRSMEDVSTLEAAGVHGRSKMRYEEIRSNDEYPRWNSSPRDGGGPYPLPVTVNRTMLLPGQTYPEPQPVSGLINIGLLNSSNSHNNNNSIQDVLLKDENISEEDPPPPPLYPKQYYARRRSGMIDRNNESPAVNRKVKPLHLSSPSATTGGSPVNTSFETVISGDNNHRGKYVPYKETTKPFEMSDFYKYSTKFRNVSASSLKSGESGGDSSDRSSTTSAGSNQPPPELPARAIIPPSVPSTPIVQTATVTPTKPKLSAQNSDSSLGDAFSSEMLAWYNNQKPNSASGTNSSSTSSSSNNNNNNKSATLV
uniref:FERM domain-containing protein n=1 Tax=Lepeophtheirus salmonis TaxID=72036 RepID=A0A0K2UBC2_LEPSM